jgi:hypothetical protein
MAQVLIPIFYLSSKTTKLKGRNTKHYYCSPTVEVVREKPTQEGTPRCFHKITIFYLMDLFFDSMDSFSLGQSGEQDAREKEMEENMNEVFYTFFHTIMEQK